MSAPVFIHPEAGAARPGSTLVLTGAEARHAAAAMRVQAGERVELVDGHGTRAVGVVRSAAPDRVEVEVDAVDLERYRELVLVQALAKGGRDEQAVEAATELGATAVIPWQAPRSIVQWKGPKAAKGREKWQDLARAATKQSRRSTEPQVAEAHSTAALVTAVRAAVGEGATVVVLHEDATEALTDLPWRDGHGGPTLDAPLWLIVGPEGGIGEDELTQLTGAGARALRLGPHVLRASTAGPAALAALQALAGDWGLR